MQEKLLDAAEAAKHINMSVWSTRKLIRENRIKPVDRIMVNRHTKKYVYSINDIDKLKKKRHAIQIRKYGEKTYPEDYPPPYWGLVNAAFNKVIHAD